MGEIIETNNYELLPNGTEKDSILNIIKNENMAKCKVTVSAGTQKGDNFVGIIHVITVEGQDQSSGEQRSVTFILKTSSRLKTFRELFKADKMFTREIFMYTSALPTFHKLQIEHNIHNMFQSYPKIYDSSVKSYDEYLLLEDMKAKGFIMRDRKQALDLNHSSFVLKELGKFHAFSFALKKYQPDLYKQYSENLRYFIIDTDDIDGFHTHQEKMARKALESLDPIKYIKEREIFEAFIGNIKYIFEPIIKGDSNNQYKVLTHGDCWNNNILYKYSDTNNSNIPTEVCFLDWQISFFASPATDLSYFIYNCMSPESLENNYNEVIRIYYNSLSNTLKQMNCDPEELFPFNELENQIKNYFHYGLISSFTLIPLFTSESDEIPDFTEIKDFSPEELEKFNIKSKNIDIYNTRMSAVIKHAIKHKYI